MSRQASWGVFALIALVLLGGCTAISGGTGQWPAALPVIAVMAVAKVANDRYRLVKWPMEFLLLSAVLMIVVNLVWLHFKELV